MFLIKFAILLFQGKVNVMYQNDTYAACTCIWDTKNNKTKGRTSIVLTLVPLNLNQEQKPLISHGVGSATEGSAEWLLDRVCKCQAWLCLLVRRRVSFFLFLSFFFFFLPLPLMPRAPVLWCSETQRTKWDVTGVAMLLYFSLVDWTFWGKMQKKEKKARPFFDELHWLSKFTEEAVQFSPSQSRKKDHTRGKEQ